MQSILPIMASTWAQQLPTVLPAKTLMAATKAAVSICCF